MISDQEVRRYHQEGYLIVPGLYTRTEVQEWKDHLKQRIQGDEGLDKGAGVRVWFCPELDDLTRSHVTANKRLLETLKQLMGPNVEFLSVKAVFKNAVTNFQSPWHQDWHYWHGSRKVSVWIALDDATPENGCLKVIPKSHRSIIEMDYIDDGKGFVNRIPASGIQGQHVIDAAVQAGDAIFFPDLTLHASCPNTNGKDRWSAISTYRNSNEQDESTIWKESILLFGERVHN